eukprot:Sspe_Gene.65759::Locus_38884_Transcript_1_2_Confidence_0.333_Length_558::g.65759::m.65759
MYNVETQNPELATCDLKLCKICGLSHCSRLWMEDIQPQFNPSTISTMASLPDPLRDRRKREDSDDDEGSLKRPRMENQQDRSVDAEVEPMPAVGTSPEIKAVAAAIMKVESDIANVERSIEKVEKQIE